jgi:hypothetical protein
MVPGILKIKYPLKECRRTGKIPKGIFFEKVPFGILN